MVIKTLHSSKLKIEQNEFSLTPGMNSGETKQNHNIRHGGKDEPNIVNKTCTLLQTTGGKDEPNIVNKTCTFLIYDVRFVFASSCLLEGTCLIYDVRFVFASSCLLLLFKTSSTSSLQQQSADRHVAPLGHIILILSHSVFFFLVSKFYQLEYWKLI
jgi:hypothetical protein